MNVVRRLLAISTLLALAACSSGSPSEKKAGEPPKPAAAAAPTPAPSPVVPTPAPTPSKAEQIAKMEQVIAGLAPKGPPPGDEDEEGTDIRPKPYTDPKTGEKLIRVPRLNPAYIAKGSRLFSTIVHDTAGVGIVREDPEAWYIAAPEARKPGEIEKAQEEIALANIIEVPALEAEVVTPPVSKTRIRFESMSQGLPRSGMWRDNFDVADLDGDGKLEIVCPPPRLSGDTIRIYGWSGEKWVLRPVELENPEALGVGYGGVAVGDVDGNGKPDIVWAGHGGGLWVALSKGPMKFRMESRGLPRMMSSRAVALGDLDGDGRLDIVAVSDEAEARKKGGDPGPGGYIPGFDVRAYINKGDRFAELTTGVERACFGYNLGLFLPKDAEEVPFVATSCRYVYQLDLVHTFDRKKLTFEHAANSVVEEYAIHDSTAVGRYRGFPAVFDAYTKLTPTGASREFTGDGVSIYYREGADWKRKRLYKRLVDSVGPQAVAVGDLNGDGIDDVVYAEAKTKRIRAFFQETDGSFSELAEELEPTFENNVSSMRIVDIDGDGRKDLAVMLHYLSTDQTRSGGLRVYRNLAP